jgi:hypothetical protein
MRNIIFVLLIIASTLIISCGCSRYSDEDKKKIYDLNAQLIQDNSWIHTQDSTIIILCRKSTVQDSILRAHGINPDSCDVLRDSVLWGK